MYPSLSSALHDPRHFEKPDALYPGRFLDAQGKFKKPQVFIPSSISQACSLSPVGMSAHSHSVCDSLSWSSSKPCVNSLGNEESEGKRKQDIFRDKNSVRGKDRDEVWWGRKTETQSVTEIKWEAERHACTQRTEKPRIQCWAPAMRQEWGKAFTTFLSWLNNDISLIFIQKVKYEVKVKIVHNSSLNLTY